MRARGLWLRAGAIKDTGDAMKRPVRGSSSDERSPAVRRDERYLRQNAGVNSTITLKISSRPSSMAAVQIQVCVAVSAW